MSDAFVEKLSSELAEAFLKHPKYIALIQAAAGRDALRGRVAEFFTIWDSDTATEAQVDEAFGKLRAAAGIPAPQDPPQQVKNPSGWGHD